jgi:hypothetical protein
MMEKAQTVLDRFMAIEEGGRLLPVVLSIRASAMPSLSLVIEAYKQSTPQTPHLELFEQPA